MADPLGTMVLLAEGNAAAAAALNTNDAACAGQFLGLLEPGINIVESYAAVPLGGRRYAPASDTHWWIEAIPANGYLDRLHIAIDGYPSGAVPGTDTDTWYVEKAAAIGGPWATLYSTAPRPTVAAADPATASFWYSYTFGAPFAVVAGEFVRLRLVRAGALTWYVTACIDARFLHVVA